MTIVVEQPNARTAVIGRQIVSTDTRRRALEQRYRPLTGAPTS